ncbi:MAG TPA: hypothetical protein VE971_00030 [Candidatus Eisenbacteria bacterium]|nr:hypothetical protein [Candidatus Eisenbacteria bacterium]
MLLDTPYISSTSSNIEIFVTPKGENTEILYGPSSVIDREIKFISNAKFTIDTCMDFTRTSITVGVEPIKKLLLDATNRNVRLRYITEITAENISYCKELMKFTELRHLDGSLSNFMVSDKEYLALGVSQGTSDLASQIIYSNVKEIIERQKYIFNTLWNKAIPVIKRIREIEYDQTSITEVLYGTENAVARGIEFMKNVKERMDICFDSKAPSIVVEIDMYRNGYEDIRNRGGKIRAFTEITNDNIHHIKELLKIVDELRHLDGMKGGIAVSETECMATTILQEATPLTQVIYSNNRAFVEQMQYIFDVFWHRAIPARQRIKEIEEGIKREFIETIQDPADVKTLVFKLMDSATHEISAIFPTVKTFERYQHEGVVQFLSEVATQRNISVRVLSAKDTDSKRQNQKLNIRYLKEPPTLQSRVITIIIDNELSLTIELKDDTKHCSSEAIGLATYSNSEATVLSYESIFEILWIESELPTK